MYQLIDILKLKEKWFKKRRIPQSMYKRIATKYTEQWHMPSNI